MNYDLMAERLKTYQTDFLSFKQKALRIQACYQRREPTILEMEVSFFVNRDKCFMPLSGLMIKLSNAILNIRMHRCRALSSTLLKHNVIITIDYIDQISKLLPVISCSTKKLSSQIKLRCTNYESKWLLSNNLLPVRTVNRKRRKEMFSTYER